MLKKSDSIRIILIIVSLLFLFFLFFFFLNINQIPLESCYLKSDAINWESYNYSKFQTNFSCGYQPNTTYEDDGFLVNIDRFSTHINQMGFRGKDHSFSNPEKNKRIVLLGDSFTFGWGLNDSYIFPTLLENQLDAYSNFSKFEVINLGVQGYDTKSELRCFKQIGINFSPDYVFLFYFHDDYIENSFLVSLWSQLKSECNLTGIKAGNIISNITLPSYYNYLHKNNSLFDLFRNRVFSPLLELQELSRENNFELYIFVFPLAIEQKELFQNFLKRNNFNSFFLQDFGYSYDPPFVLHKKDPHPSIIGHKWISEFLFNKILLDSDQNIPE